MLHGNYISWNAGGSDYYPMINRQLTEFLAKNPEADAQHIRQLIRNAKKELAIAKPPKSSRLLFCYLRELMENELDKTEEWCPLGKI